MDYTIGESVFYDYISNHLLCRQTDHTGYYVSYAYDAGHRVQKVEEYYASSTTKLAGQTYSIKYGDDNTNTFRFSGVNDIYGDGDGDDVLNTYAFDEKGRPVCVYSKILNDEKVVGANAYSYEDDAVTNVVRTTTDDTKGTTTTNLLKNGNFEDVQNGFPGWYPFYDDFWFQQTNIIRGNCEVEKNNFYVGKTACKVGARNADYLEVIAQNVSLEPGTYTLSCFILDKDLNGVVPIVAFTQDREQKYSFNSWKTADKAMTVPDTGGNEKWVRLTRVFEVTENTGKQAVLFGTMGGDGQALHGDVIFDGFVLEKGDTSYWNYQNSSASTADEANKKYRIKDYAVTGLSSDNLLKDHSFENNDNQWTLYKALNNEKNKSVSIAKEEPYFGNQTLTFKTATMEKGAYGASQKVKVKKGKTYTFSGYCKMTNRAKDAAQPSTIKASLIVKNQAGAVVADHYDNRNSFIEYETSAEFNEGWERLTVTFTATADMTVDCICNVTCSFEDANATKHKKETTAIYFDCMQFEESKVANQYNLLDDSSFEIGSTDANGKMVPYKWQGYTKTCQYQDEVTKNGSLDGGYCYKITGEASRYCIHKEYKKRKTIEDAITASLASAINLRCYCYF